MKKCAVIAALLVAVSVCMPTEAEICVLPYPTKVVEKKGEFKVPSSKKLTACVRFSKNASLPKEGYTLSVTASGIKVASSDKAGAFYALKTLEQLAKTTNRKTVVPCVEIEDFPRYSWRGLHLDESRHFFGKETVKALLDQMSRFKLNRFHWHLTDDQGWRIEIPGHPELIEYGSWRPYSPKRPPEGGPCNNKKQIKDGKKYGPFYYTESDIKEVIAYAAERHIEIVPEIEFPGHFRAALAAYPAYACFPEKIKSRCGRGSWGIEVEVMCAGNDEAIKFIEEVLDYVCKIFPYECVHIGGDECPKRRWKDCPKCQARIKAEGLKDEHALQAWLTRHMVGVLAKRGKRTIGWAEYLGAGVPSEAMGMVWMGQNVPKVVARATKKGHDMIVCPSPICYLNHGQGLENDPYPYGGGGRTIEKCYAFNPSDGVSGDAEKHVLGGQGCQWTEYSWNRNDLEWKYWPRMMALAEAFWLGEKKPGFEDFKRRAVVRRKALVDAGVNCAPIE